jgi:hypothetical protein
MVVAPRVKVSAPAAVDAAEPLGRALVAKERERDAVPLPVGPVPSEQAVPRRSRDRIEKVEVVRMAISLVRFVMTPVQLYRGKDHAFPELRKTKNLTARLVI